MNSFFQTQAWALFKQKSGWRSERKGNTWILKKKLGGWLYFDYVPEMPFAKESLVDIRPVLSEKRQGVVFSRFEFLEEWNEFAVRELKALGLVKSFEEVQPEHRQWVPLVGNEENLLGQMKPKGRYNIRVAEKHNLRTEITQSDAALKEFHRLYQETSRRNQFQGRSYAYFRELLSTLVESKVGEIIVVRSDSTALAAGIFIYWDGVCSYLYGASGGDRQLMAPYLMHWEAMKRAKERNCHTYDLLAVAPNDDPNHPYANLSRFKSQFGGRTVRLLGSWDFIRKPLWYRIYQFLERRRRQVLR